MKEVVLITGANGMLAKQLHKTIMSNYEVRFLTRVVRKENEYRWDIPKNYIDPKALKGVHHIIHLAGTSIADKRWSKKRKESIFSSRIDSTKLLLKELIKHQISIDSFISASAIGYYGTETSDDILTEESPSGNDFLSQVCINWEQAAQEFLSNSISKRVVIVRIGIILSKTGAALEKMAQPIRYGLGAGIGDGNQYMPWIHIEDLCEMFNYILLNKDLKGVYNGVAPNHVTNDEFTNKLAVQLNRKVILPNIPNWVLKAILGEMSIILREGSRISSEKIINTGFGFKYDNLDIALRNLIEKEADEL